MTVAYKEIFPGVKAPILHTVFYGIRFDGTDADQQQRLFNYRVDSWLRENCRAAYYHSTYHVDKFIQFEDDEDAVLFALRWGK